MYQAINGFTKKKMIEVIKQNFKGKSYDSENDACMYRGPNGKKCVVGCFIPDDVEIDSGTNRSGVNLLLQQHPSLKPLMPLDEESLKWFQSFHDTDLCIDDSVEAQTKDLIGWVEENVIDAAQQESSSGHN